METHEALPVVVKRPGLTPKALIHQKYGSKACYKIEDVQVSVDNGCPGLVTPQQAKFLYRCYLDLPELSVTSDTCTKKKDAEQSAAKIAVEKLGIQSTMDNPTPQEAWNELVARISGLFSDEFLSSSHPLIGHLRAAIGRVGSLFGMVPMAIIAAYDVKVTNLCKVINIKAESDPLLVISLIMKAARMSISVCTSDGELWIWKRGPFSPEALQSSIQQSSASVESIQIEVIRIPCSIGEHVETLTLDISCNQYYMDKIAEKLYAKDSSRVMVSRTVGKSSSEMRLYYPAPEIPCLASDSAVDILSNAKNNVNLEAILNKRASYFSGQNIYGDAILANVGYTWKSSGLFYEDVSLCTYYRMLLGKVPDGHYKLSREAILAAELPTTFTVRSNWRGPSPRDLLCMFCRQHRLSEPYFSVKNLSSSETPSESLEACKKHMLSKLTDEAESANGDVGDATDGELDGSSTFRCDVRILSKVQDAIVECSCDVTCRKETDAIHNASLKVLTWFNKYFKQFNMPMENLSSFGHAHNIKVYPLSFSREFMTCLAIHGVQQNNYCRECSYPGSICIDKPNNQENGMILFNCEGSDSGVFPTPGSLTCISYDVALVRKGECLKEPLESKDEFEFEIGTGAVINELEACVTQLSINQAAQFTIELPSRDLILAAAGESAKRLSQLSLFNCFLEYSIKVLRVTEPLEDRMEQALFCPPLSKQRVEFAVGQINEFHATTLVDFGCGSGSLLESLLEHTTTLEKIVGVDISRKGLTRAAKIIHSKLSKNSMSVASVRSAVLYDGSITDFDSRLYDFDIGTCLEVIEHIEEDQASLFGDVALGYFCPRVLIVSTPNYEYNPILQRSGLPKKEDDLDEKSLTTPCKFRNHDHKFEWTRQQFEHWATSLAARHDYSVEFSGVGGSGDIEPGFASQIAVFSRRTLHQSGNCLMNEESSHPYEVLWEWTNSSRSAL